MPEETRRQRKENVRHILETHDDHTALMRVLARRFGVTPEFLQAEIVKEIDNMQHPRIIDD